MVQLANFGNTGIVRQTCCVWHGIAGNYVHSRLSSGVHTQGRHMHGEK